LAPGAAAGTLAPGAWTAHRARGERSAHVDRISKLLSTFRSAGNVAIDLHL
jgi:hypothetical protein